MQGLRDLGFRPGGSKAQDRNLRLEIRGVEQDLDIDELLSKTLLELWFTGFGALGVQA